MKTNHKRKTDHYPRPTKKSLTVLHQLCKFIPGYLMSQLARQTGVDKQARDYSPWSHVVTLLFAQLTRALGLNDVCDALRHHRAPLAAIRGAAPPSRNGLSHANKVRDAGLAEQLFWAVLAHLHQINPRFGGRHFQKFPHRFKRAIHVCDATVIHLVMNCFDWARHRRRKAAAKCHLRLDLLSFLPRFVLVDPARIHEARQARALCAGIRAGEIALFDMAYVDLAHLDELTRRGVGWVTRVKENMRWKVVKKLRRPAGKILRDEVVELVRASSRRAYPQRLRRVTALVELDGKEVAMEFLTNNFAWAPATVADLYRCRWAIETFFRQIKQTLNLCDFLGYSANAVRWQIWTALLLYVLLRFQACLSRWEHSFTRLFTLVRGVVWDRFHLCDLLDFYGTAGVRFRWAPAPAQACLPGLA